MNILEKLQSKPGNSHHINRYYNYILACKTKNINIIEYSENHHILPKAKDMFPEFKSLKDNPWNSIILTHRQHIIAHYILMKAYNNQSQILSYIFTTNQFNAKSIKLNSKFIARAKMLLSAASKGIFTRGYTNGVPNVSDNTKLKLSQAKKQFYSNLVNRENQSKACMGTKKRISSKYKEASINRTIEHKEKLQTSIKAAWTLKKLNNDTKRVKDGIYITPIGVFTSISDYRSYCKDSNKIFTIHSTKKNPKLNKSIIGKTPKDLGFFFISKVSLEFSQYCVDLNQAHLPEPNHPLWLELNDYLLREKLLPQT